MFHLPQEWGKVSVFPKEKVVTIYQCVPSLPSTFRSKQEVSSETTMR